MGHEERFPLPKLSGSCGSGYRAFAGLRRNEEHAPKPALYAAARERASYDHCG